MIPEAAIEAAAISLYFDDISAEFPGEHPESRDACLRAARKALEAAAPHMLAGAWLEGYAEGELDGAFQRNGHEPPDERNPYRPTSNNGGRNE